MSQEASPTPHTRRAGALELALAYQHPYCGTSHLLLALIDDDNDGGSAHLSELGVDPARLREQVAQDLSAAPTWS